MLTLPASASLGAGANPRHVARGTVDRPAPLGKVDRVLTFRGRAGEGPTKDAWFSFTVSTAAMLEIKVDQPRVTFDLRRPGSREMNGVLVSTAFSGAHSIEHKVKAGTYLLRTYADTPLSYEVILKARRRQLRK